MTWLASSGGIALLKTFIIGILLGIAAAAGALYAYPAVDQHRESSIVAVAPNGGNVESFHVTMPMDRVMVGAPGRKQPMPPGLQWPIDEELNGIRMELFKVRNARDIVIGVASRTSARDADVIEWVLHLPARGSLYVSMQAQALEGGIRRGGITAGSREFAPLKGFMTERWVADKSGEPDGPSGRIELRANYIGEFVPEDEEGLE